MSLEMSTDTVFKFLELYKEHSVLWDPTIRGHRMADARRKAWRTISQELGVDIDTLKKKYESLMATFRKLKKTAEEHAEPGATYGEVYAARATNIQWYAWDKMRFLLGRFHPDDVFDKKPGFTKTVRPVREMPAKSRVPIREVPPSSPEQELEEEYLECPDDDEDNDHMDNGDDSADEDFLIKVEPKTEPPRDVQRQFKPRMRQVRLKRSAVRLRRSQPLKTEHKQRVANNMLLPHESRRMKDECDTFGEYVACSLRKHDQRAQAMIKQAINNIIFEQEMKKYGNNARYTVISPDNDDNPLSMEQET